MSSLFSKLLERRNLSAGLHSYSIILEPKKASIPEVISLPTCNKTQLRETLNSKSPSWVCFCRGDLFLTLCRGPSFLPWNSHSFCLLFSCSILPPGCGNLLHQTAYSTVRENSGLQNRYKCDNYSKKELFDFWFMSHLTPSSLPQRQAFSIIFSPHS